ncbi:transposase, partial [Legionella pneumophila]
VFHYHSKGVSQKDLARDLKLGKSTVERWYHYGYELRYKKIATRSCPRVLGLDEHSFNRKVGYATTFCDLAKHKIFDVVEGRSEKDLEGYLNTLEGKDKVQVVCIDLSSSYRKLIRRYFPNA